MVENRLPNVPKANRGAVIHCWVNPAERQTMALPLPPSPLAGEVTTRLALLAIHMDEGPCHGR